MKIKYITLGTLLSVAFFACNPKPDPGSQNDTSQIARESIDTALATTGTVNDFAHQAAIGGMMEVESSARMIKSTENPDIQTLATMMVKDHGAANDELKAIAKKENLNLPQTLPADKVEELKKLEGLQEYELNRQYAALMVKEHQEAVALFLAASTNETNAALNAFAKKHLPTLKAHLTHTENVSKMIESIKNDKGDRPLKTSKDRNP